MSPSPMPFGCDVPNVLSLARSVVADFSRAPDVFNPGERAANALISELDVFQRFCSSQTSQAKVADESSLAAHLMPCRSALKSMVDIRQKYPGQTMGFGDSLKWKLDEKRFEREAAALRDATTQLRETVQLLQTAIVNPHSQSRGAQSTQRWQPAPTFGSHVSVQIAQGLAVSQVSLTRSSSASVTSGSQEAGVESTKPMCPRGSGCREPSCHRKNNHPWAPNCEVGKNCCVPGCTKWHPKSPHCHNGLNCPRINSGCSKAHPWPRPPPQPNNSYWSTLTAQTQPVQSEQSEDWGRGSAASSTTSSYLAPTLVTVVSSLSQASTSTPEWCPNRWSCPDYNLDCPYKHPKRAPCRDGSDCRKGSACTYDHCMQVHAQASTPPGHIAELPGSRRYK